MHFYAIFLLASVRVGLLLRRLGRELLPVEPRPVRRLRQEVQGRRRLLRQGGGTCADS